MVKKVALGAAYVLEGQPVIVTDIGFGDREKMVCYLLTGGAFEALPLAIFKRKARAI